MASAVNTEGIWREIAAAAGGAYLRVPQSGGAQRITTPYDDQLALHASMLDQTRQPYGSADVLSEGQARRERSEKIRKSSSAEALADRAVYMGTDTGLEAAGEDLVSDIAEGRIRLEDIPEEQLPAEVRQLEPERRQLHLDGLAERRRGILSEIAYFAEERRDYVERRVSASRDAFDTRILEVLRRHGLAVPR